MLSNAVYPVQFIKMPLKAFLLTGMKNEPANDNYKLSAIAA